MVETGNMTETGNIEKVASQQADITERLSKALEIDSDSYYESIPSKDGQVTEIAKKVYQLESPIGKRSSLTVYDVGIIESMEKIHTALHGRTILNYLICKEFSKIASSGKLENMGFKNIAEFGKAVYGLESSTVNHYTRIGFNFINDDYTVKAGLPELSVSHFIELNACVTDEDGIDKVIELYQQGTLVDGMSTKKIRDVLREIKNPQLEDKSDKTDKSDKSDKSDNSEKSDNTVSVATDNEMQELKVHFDSQVVVGKIINACNVIDELFKMLNENEIKAIGYEEKLNSLKALAKALL